jgi:transposase
MEAILKRCCGMDIHKKIIVACLLIEEKNGDVEKSTRHFPTMTDDLLRMKAWLIENGCTDVAMESTSVYWKPIFNILEDSMNVMIVNARLIKNVPGRKTDMNDSEWIAKLLRHGLLRNSFIPPRDIRDLRDLTRYRVKLVQNATSEKNRIQKILEDANIKLSSVLSKTFSVSGTEMIKAIIQGDSSPVEIADLARRRLRSKIPELIKALKGNVTEHHRFMLTAVFDHLNYIFERIADLEKRIEEKLQPYREIYELLMTIPGVSKHTAASIIAEIGVDMSVFPSSKHIASWAGVCPGNNESAGKRMSGKTRKGDSYLRVTLTEAAWAASKTKGNYLPEKYRKLAHRRGRKRAIMAISHKILCIVYNVIKKNEPYKDLGSNYLEQLHKESSRRNAVNRLKSLGFEVSLTPSKAVS